MAPTRPLPLSLMTDPFPFLRVSVWGSDSVHGRRGRRRAFRRVELHNVVEAEDVLVLTRESRELLRVDAERL